MTQKLAILSSVCVMDPRILFVFVNFWALWTILSPSDGSIFSNTCHVHKYHDGLVFGDAFAIMVLLFDFVVTLIELRLIKP